MGLVDAYLFFLGVKLEAFVQSAAVLLLMELLLQPHAFCILNHFLLDVAKQTVKLQMSGSVVI